MQLETRAEKGTDSSGVERPMASSVIFGTTVATDCQPQDDVGALLAKRMNATRRPVRDTSVVP